MAQFSAMSEALRLTRGGDLHAATRLIQNMLAGRPASDARPTAYAGEMIDLIPSPVAVEPSKEAKRIPLDFQTFARQGTFSEQRHNSAHGSLDYRLYLPAKVAPGMPLVVMLHGCTQSPEDFAMGTGMNDLAEELAFIVGYPRQSRAANAQRCWNWFETSHQQCDQGEPALIAGMVRDILKANQADPQRVYVAGLSAGGAAAAVLAARYPDMFAAVGVHSGLACGAASDMPSAFAAMRTGTPGRGPTTRADTFVPVITFHGDRDHTVHQANSDRIIQKASSAYDGQMGTTIEQGRSEGGRTYQRETSVDVSGRVAVEQWTIHGAGHAWSGGKASFSYTDPKGPDASRAMLDFFRQHRLAA